MARPLILLGDATSHGGVVVKASDQSGTENRRVARVGDAVTCPKKGHGHLTAIVTGDSTLLIDGFPAAREGDLTACGAVLIASQTTMTAE